MDKDENGNDGEKEVSAMSRDVVRESANHVAWYEISSAIHSHWDREKNCSPKSNPWIISDVMLRITEWICIPFPIHFHTRTHRRF
jgi:hypothetical protein